MAGAGAPVGLCPVLGFVGKRINSFICYPVHSTTPSTLEPLSSPFDCLDSYNIEAVARCLPWEGQCPGEGRLYPTGVNTQSDVAKINATIMAEDVRTVIKRSSVSRPMFQL